MEIIVSIEEGRIPVTVFHINGNIDANTYQSFEKQSGAEIEKGTRNVIVDLNNVNFISSAGLRVLNQIDKRLRAFSPKESTMIMKKGIMEGSYKSKHLKVVCEKETVLETFKTSGFDMYIEIYPTIKEALDSF